MASWLEQSNSLLKIEFGYVGLLPPTVTELI